MLHALALIFVLALPQEKVPVSPPQPAVQEDSRQGALALAERCKTALLATQDADGFPHVRALSKMGQEGLAAFWFVTDASSKKVAALKANPRAGLYFLDEGKMEGLMLLGTVQLVPAAEAAARKDCPASLASFTRNPRWMVLRFVPNIGSYTKGFRDTEIKP